MFKIGVCLLVQHFCLCAEPMLTITDASCDPLVVSPPFKANVLFFTTTDCPIANGYSQRFNEMYQEYGMKGFNFYLVHIDWQTTKTAALRHQKEFQLQMPIVLDSTHALVKKTGVETTPEVVVLLPDQTIAYCGRIDNWYEGFGKKRNVVTKTELKDALEAIIDNRTIPVNKTRAIGCSIPELPRK